MKVMRNGRWIEIETGTKAREDEKARRESERKAAAENAELIRALNSDDYATIERITGVPMDAFSSVRSFFRR